MVHRRDHVLGVGGGEVQEAVVVGVLAGVNEAVSLRSLPLK